VSRSSGESLAARALGRTAEEHARALALPKEAVELVWGSEVIDLHLESFIPPRLYGYDVLARHSHLFPFFGHFFGHLDVPRAIEGGLTGAMWSIATNISRTPARRFDVLGENVRNVKETLERSGTIAIARTHGEYVAARAAGKHAALVSVQGGNAFEGAGALVNPEGLVTRVTVVHLSNSVLGATSSPLRRGADAGLTDRGRDFIRWLDAERIFVDLAHASPRSFWDAVEVHDRTRPLIVTHTGIADVHPMWRNIDGKQVRAVADTGGVVAIIFHRAFLGPRVKDGRVILDHIEAAIAAGGEECVALGSDYDGFIIPPSDLRDGGTAFYRLVAYMLERGWREERIRNVLGANFLRSFARLRP
jgi:membrane dipeptidase